MVLPISNCKRCDRIFNRIRRDICQACIAEEDKAFQTVRDFLKLHKDASMTDVQDGTGVDMELIIEMIQDGRLILRDNPNLAYGCERCGSQTQSGRYCAKCTKELSNALTAAATELRQKNAEQNALGKGFHSR